MHHFKFIFLCLILVLAGCSEAPLKKFDKFVAEKDYNGAISWLDGKLAEKNKDKDPLLNALSAEMRLTRCFATNCFDEAPEELKMISKHLTFIDDGFIDLPDNAGKRDVYGNISQILEKNAGDESYNARVLQLIKAMSAGAPREKIYALALTSAVNKLKNIQPEEAAKLLISLSELNETQDFNSHYTAFLAGLLNNDLNILNTRIAALSAKQENAEPLALLNEALPYALFIYETKIDERDGTTAFLNAFYDNIKGFNIAPLLEETSRAVMADTLQKMPQNAAFMAEALSHYIKPQLTTVVVKKEIEEAPAPAQESSITAIPSIEVEAEETVEIVPETVNVDDSTYLIKLFLLKQALLLSPEKTELWAEYLPAALEFSHVTGDASLLKGLDSAKIPPAAAKPYNTKLVELITTQIASGQDVMELIQQMIVPEKEQDTMGFGKQRDLLVTQALSKEIANKHVERVIAYAEFSPDVARQQRQKIVTLLIGAIEDKWHDDNYEDMLSLAEFLVKDMGIDFNLDSLLLQSFEAYLKEINITETLKAESFDLLLKPQEEVQIDLGPKFAFLTKHFSNNPAIIDTQLKNLVIKAEGKYGAATALYRLDHFFDDNLFPAKERKSFFISSLKKSLNNDKSLDGPAMAKSGYALHKNHPDLPLLFIVGETLSRIDSLESGRTVWQNVSEDFKGVLKAIKPQFNALMEGIDAFDADHFSTAADKFVVLGDLTYVEQAQQYLEDFRTNLKDLTGIYLLDQHSDATNVLLLTVELASQDVPFSTANLTKAAASPETEVEIARLDLTGLEFGFINAVGSVKTVMPEKLSEDYGKTFEAILKTNIDPDTLAVTLTSQQRSNAQSEINFSKTFGEIEQLKFVNAGLEMRIKGVAEPFLLRRISTQSKTHLFPNGTYGITQQLSEANPTTDHVLPVGSILTLTTNDKDAVQPVKNGQKLSVIYPVTGTLKHPAAPREHIVVEGFYDTEKYTVNLAYRYPYGATNTMVDAVVRCHIPDNYLVCAGHNKHWSRSQHSHIVTGRKALSAHEKAEKAAKEADPNTQRYAPEVQTFEPVDVKPVVPHEKTLDDLF